LTVTTTLGGKAGRAPASWLLLEALESPFEEALPPLADDLPRCIETRCDLVIAEALCRQEDDLCPNHFSIRRRISTCQTFEESLFLVG
jgi:hypothetical protein